LVDAALFIPGAILGGLLGLVIIHPVNQFLGRIFRGFNAGFEWLTGHYGKAVGRAARVSTMVLVIYGGLLVLTAVSMNRAPKGFIPLQDQGYLLVNVQLPDSASVQRTLEIMQKVRDIALPVKDKDGNRVGGIPGVAHTMAVAGQSFLLNANAPYFGSCFVILEPFDKRKSHEKYDEVIAEKLRARFAAEIEGAEIQVFRAPPIQGLGTAGGFKLQIEQRGYSDMTLLQKQTDAIVEQAQQNPKLVGVFTMFRSDTPQIYLDIDRSKCESFGVDVQSVFNTLQVYMGGYYVNLFNEFGRTWQVNLLAEPQYRTQTSDLKQLKVRNKFGQMVPLASVMRAESVGGPSMVMRYNMYASAPVVGNPAPGTSTGDIISIMENLVEKNGATSEWTEIIYMQTLEGNYTIFIFLLGSALVFLVLAAKYESWRLPFSVILVVPMCLLCATVGMLIARLPIDIFVQIGFLVLVGMAAKNAILIVEFAKQLHDEGKPLMEATVEASRLRLRPIIMTSFAFILGVLPLVISEGAGAEMRQSLGTAVFTGMIGVAAFGIFLTPVFFYVMMRLSERSKGKNEPVLTVVDEPPAPML
jgi:multidrug efflux pump